MQSSCNQSGDVLICPLCNNRLVLSALSALQSYIHFDEYVCNVFDKDSLSFHLFRLFKKDSFIEGCTILFTKHFKVYLYTDFGGAVDKVNVYHKKFPRDLSIQQPCFSMKVSEFDYSKIKYYDEKWHKLSIFA